MTRFLKKFQNVTFLVSAKENLRINFDWDITLVTCNVTLHPQKICSHQCRFNRTTAYIKWITYVLVIADRFFQWPVAVPLPDSRTQTILNAFKHSWLSLYGVPEKLTTDRGLHFFPKNGKRQ